MSVEQREVNGEVLVAVLLGIRASAAALQQQTEAALSLLGVETREQTAQRAEDVLTQGPARPVFGEAQVGRIAGT